MKYFFFPDSPQAIGELTGMTAGAIPFGEAGGGGLAQDATNLVWDDTNNRLGLGKAAPLSILDATGNIATGTTFKLTNNTGNVGAFARLALQTGGASSGDPYIYLNNEITNWSLGIDNSDSDYFKISNSNVVGTSDYMTVNTSGNIGVGTADPLSKLHVYTGNSDHTPITASILLEGASTARMAFAIDDDSTGNDAGLFVSTPADVGANFIRWYNFTAASVNSGSMQIKVGNSFPIAATKTTVDLVSTTITGDLTLDSGVITMQETTTPSATTNYGKVYTKTDNKLYFQDGAGTEHEIAFV